MRAFLALEIPQPVRSALAALQSQLAASGADVAWVSPDRLHVTMRFLGEISDEQRRQMEAGAKRIASSVSPFDVWLTQPGAFPSLRAPRVLWVGIGQGHDRLAELAEGLEQASVQAGLKLVEDPANHAFGGFVAHVTIGRVRSSTRPRELSASLASVRWEPPPAFLARGLTFFQSTLQRGGPLYTALAELPFGKCQTLPKAGEVSDTS